MAVTKIWTVSDSITRILGYVSNPDKTEYDDLRSALHYAGDEAKTEKAKFVSGINTTEKTAYEDMMAVKKRFGKTTGSLAFHAYQSFKPGEVTPELCHKIGLETARKLWGDKYQVIVATHLNKEHLHNHFVINSISFVGGKRLPDKYETYYNLRRTSDAICKNHDLSVIKNPDGKTPRVIYLAEKEGAPTRYNLMREAIDLAVSNSTYYDMFARNLREQGYIIHHSENRKYDTIRIIGEKKTTRLYHLGEKYDSLETIIDR
ncbi:MAG TPA: relaxase/mobilization nuclease domain-containing protein, partial [Bacillota bacterium]|nr:relaxase/mobilization nuclease domain-containing protein [Bacillota bacterium]